MVDATLLSSVDVTSGLKAKGAIIVNSEKAPEELRPMLKGYAGKVYTIDAGRISEDELGRNLPNIPMLGAVVKVSGIIPEDKLVSSIEGSLWHKFANKPQVVAGNMRALKRSMTEVRG